MTTAGVMQDFASTPHEPVLVAALTAAEDQDHVGTGQCAAQASRVGPLVAAGAAGGTPGSLGVSQRRQPEEAERLRQLEMVRRSRWRAAFAKTSRDR